MTHFQKTVKNLCSFRREKANTLFVLHTAGIDGEKCLVIIPCAIPAKVAAETLKQPFQDSLTNHTLRGI